MQGYLDAVRWKNMVWADLLRAKFDVQGDKRVVSPVRACLTAFANCELHCCNNKHNRLAAEHN